MSSCNMSVLFEYHHRLSDVGFEMSRNVTASIISSIEFTRCNSLQHVLFCISNLQCMSLSAQGYYYYVNV